MKKLLNTLYITNEKAYLSLDGENVVISEGKKQLGRVPLHTLDSIFLFGYIGASPALMGKCAELNKQLVLLKPNGRFLAKIHLKHLLEYVLACHLSHERCGLKFLSAWQDRKREIVTSRMRGVD